MEGERGNKRKEDHTGKEDDKSEAKRGGNENYVIRQEGKGREGKREECREERQWGGETLNNRKGKEEKRQRRQGKRKESETREWEE